MAKKIISLAVVILSFLAVLSVTVSAKVDLPDVSSDKPLLCYTLSSSGKAYAYSDPALKKKNGDSISPEDKISIIAIKKHSVKAKYVKNGKTKKAWFSTETFTNRNLYKDGAKIKFRSLTEATVYKRKSKSEVFDTLPADKACFLLRGDSDSKWVQIFYCASGKYQMGFITAEDYDEILPTVKKVKLNKTKLTLKGKNAIANLSATVTPAKAVDGKIEWYSTDTSVVKVSSNGKVRAVNNGTAKIVAKTANGKKAVCKVTVNNVKASKVTLDTKTVALSIGKTYSLSATSKPANNTDELIWKSSAPSVAEVSSKGQIIAKDMGTAVITAKTSSGKTAKVDVTVSHPVQVKLNVPSYKQFDSKWATVKLPGGGPLRRSGCITTCIAMLYSYHNGVNCTPDRMISKLSYSGGDFIWGCLENLGLEYVENYCTFSNSVMKTIYQKLREGKPVMLGFAPTGSKNQHWVVVTGYVGNSKTNFKASDFTINDAGSSYTYRLSDITSKRNKIKGFVW